MDNTCSIQLISGEGVFNVNGLEYFSKFTNLGAHGLSYAVVSVIGPQSSGKSTLLNHVFGTNFGEMNAAAGRHQTTQGIWLAKASDIDPFTLVFDVEGADGEEREERTLFEKQSALFALAMSDVLIINLWIHDVGREQAGCRPLLRTVFQVMTRLCSPRRRTLLFVIRDKTESSTLEGLTQQLKQSIQKIYDSVSKPETHREMGNFFKVHVTALPHYELQRTKFDKEVVSLRQRFIHSTTSGGLAGDQQDRVPASGISCSAQSIWDQIKENKDLDLPAHKIMVATVRCEKIMEDVLADFVRSQEWHPPLSEFGKQMTSSIYMCLSKYDEAALCFDEGVRGAKRHALQDNLLQLVQPAYQSMLACLHAETFSYFKGTLSKALENGEEFRTAYSRCWYDSLSAFDEGCRDLAIEQANWDSSNDVRAKLTHDMNAHIALVDVQVTAAKAAAKAADDAAAQAAEAANHIALLKAQVTAAKAAADAAARAAAQARGHREGGLLRPLIKLSTVGANIALTVMGLGGIGGLLGQN